MKEKTLWFRAKKFGWGWTPVAWQGWVSTFVYVLLLFLEFRKADTGSHSGSDTLINFALPFALITLLFLFLAWGTGERPQWRWGTKSK